MNYYLELRVASTASEYVWEIQILYDFDDNGRVVITAEDCVKDRSSIVKLLKDTCSFFYSNQKNRRLVFPLIYTETETTAGKIYRESKAVFRSLGTVAYDEETMEQPKILPQLDKYWIGRHSY